MKRGIEEETELNPVPGSILLLNPIFLTLHFSITSFSLVFFPFLSLSLSLGMSRIMWGERGGGERKNGKRALNHPNPLSSGVHHTCSSSFSILFFFLFPFFFLSFLLSLLFQTTAHHLHLSWIKNIAPWREQPMIYFRGRERKNEREERRERERILFYSFHERHKNHLPQQTHSSFFPFSFIFLLFLSSFFSSFQSNSSVTLFSSFRSLDLSIPGFPSQNFFLFFSFSSLSLSFVLSLSLSLSCFEFFFR